MPTCDVNPQDDRIARGVQCVRRAAYDDGARAGFLGVRGDMRYIPRHFRSDWERGYEAGSRHMQEIQHAEVRTTAQVERGLRPADRAGRVEWLHREWERLDAWLGERRAPA